MRIEDTWRFIPIAGGWPRRHMRLLLCPGVGTPSIVLLGPCRGCAPTVARPAPPLTALLCGVQFCLGCASWLRGHAAWCAGGGSPGIAQP